MTLNRVTKTKKESKRQNVSFLCIDCNISLNLLSANPTKWSNTFKQFVGNLPTNCLSVFDRFLKLALKGLNKIQFWANFTHCSCVFYTTLNTSLVKEKLVKSDQLLVVTNIFPRPKINTKQKFLSVIFSPE